MRAGLAERARDAGDPLVRLDREEPGLDLERAIAHLAAVFGEMLLGAEVRVDVDRPDQPLLPERTLGRHDALHPAQADGGDLQDEPPQAPFLVARLPEASGRDNPAPLGFALGAESFRIN